MSDAQKTRNRRKIRAILAGGTVLGLGAAITLAAWNDSVFAEGNFATGDFNIQGDFGTGFDEYDTEATAGVLAFTLSDVADNLAPGDTVYAPVDLRVATVAGDTPGSYNADVVLVGAEDTGPNPELFDALLYQVWIDTTDCDAATGRVGGTALTGLGADVSLDTGSGTVGPPIAPSFGLEASGTPRTVCFVVTLPYGASGEDLQAMETLALWEFYAEPNNVYTP